MIGIDIFSGAGGMALGARNAGINIMLAVEIDKYSSRTYASNLSEVNVLKKDILSIASSDLPMCNEEKILFGGPPCQGFSTSNQKNRNLCNAHNWLFKGFIRIIDLWHPDWIVFENVKGLIETEKGLFYKSILNDLKARGYTISNWILNSVNYGVPQLRSRLFIVGSLKGIKLDKPENTISKPVTVREAISDLPVLSNGASFKVLPYKFKKPSNYAKKMRGNLSNTTNHLVTKNANYVIERYKHIPQGGNWEHIPVHLMKNYKDRLNCHTGIYKRLKENEPSLVIGNFRKNMLIHPIQDRGLSVREAARLQSFPDWYDFKGSIGFQQQQVGNAVPPLMAEAVFQKILMN